jgi:hypothetical protein
VRTWFIGRGRCRFQLNVRHSARRWLEICQHFVGVNDALFLILMCWGENPFFVVLASPLQHVASLFRNGVAENEIAEDFPGLSARDLAYARLSSRLSERPGRPRKRLELRSGLRA